MPVKFKRYLIALVVTGAVILYACRLPGMVVERITGGAETPTTVLTATAVPTPLAITSPLPIPSPTVAYPPPYPGIATAYPDLATAAPVAETPYPETGSTEAPVTSSPYPQPAGSSETPAASLVASASATFTGAAPGGAASSTPTPTLQAAVTITPTLTAQNTMSPAAETTYPGAYPGIATFTPPPNIPYPGVTVSPEAQPAPATSTAIASATQTPAGTMQVTGLPTASPTLTQPAQALPGASLTVGPVTPAISPTATPTFAPPATSTHTPTRTPYLTPTPSLTPTPTVTPTPPPAPPWVSSRLRATDPGVVQLASGRVQLVMFFAFWSGPSQAMAPVVHSLEQQYGDQMNFVYLDIDDPDTAPFKRKLGYRYLPHFFLLDEQGKTLKQWGGYATYDQLRQEIEAALR